jgi:hypothetical protein
MGFRIENKATELLIHDVGRKNITYYSKDNLSVKAEAGEIVILDNNEEILRADSTQIDDPSVNGVYDLVTTIKAYLQSDGGDSFSGGWADYADFATTGTPLNVTAVYSVITNDGLSVNTNTSYLQEGVTQLWDSSTNSFDWSELKIGDMIDIRLDLSVTIVTNNTAVDVDLFMGFGGSIDVPFISAQNFKTAGTYNLIRYQGLYIGSDDVRNNAAQLKIKADHNCTCVVNGWYVRCIRKGIV